MARRMSVGNLGKTAFPLTRRSRDPMATFDALPQPLRQWLAHAALPWSPASCLRLWRKLRAQGADTDRALQMLADIQDRNLRRHREKAGIPTDLPDPSGR